MSVINRQPTGLLGFLGIKNFGRNPTQIAETLAPTWDLADLYLSANRRWFTANATVTGVGTYQTGQVPPGQVWHVQAYSAISNVLAGAGAVLSFRMAIMNVSLGYPVILSGTGTGRILTGAAATLGIPFPIIVQAGQSLAFHVYEHAGANVPVTVSACYTVLEA